MKGRPARREVSSAPRVAPVRAGALHRVLWIVLSAALLSALPAAPSAQADARSDYLVRLLQTSSAFRVRAQAAISLGSVTPDDAVVSALAPAVQRDDNAAVRAAAAASLERLATPSAAALSALRAASRDRETAVSTAAAQALRSLERVASSGGGGAASRGGSTSSAGSGSSSGPARFYVGVGTPGSRAESLDRSVLGSARDFIASRVRAMPGVEIAPDGETPRAATAVLRSRSLSGYYLDSSIVSLEVRADGGVRAQVSIIVQSYPGRDVRSMLSGAATVMGETGVAAQRAAVEGALQSALRNLPTAMSASAGR